MKWYKSYLEFCFMLLCIALITSCENTEETFDQFLTTENIATIGMPTAISSRAGTERVRFKVAIPADPRIKSGLVEWFEGGELKTYGFEVEDSSRMDTVEFIIENVEEGIKQFTFYLFDDDKRSSATLKHTQAIYGPGYQSRLLARRIDKLVTFATKTGVDSASISWSLPLSETLESIVTYTDLDGKVHKIIVPGDSLQTGVKGFDRLVPFSIETRYIPEPDALDTYVSDASKGVFPEVVPVSLNKSLWSLELLPNDLPAQSGPYKLNSAWDGNPETYAATLGVPGPHHFTIDLGVSEAIQLSEFSWAGFPLFSQVEVKNYQVWGIADITDAETAKLITVDRLGWEAEMESKGWIKLLENTREQGDEEHASAINNKAFVKFVRIVVIDSFSPQNPDIAWGEIGLKGFLIF